MRVQSCSMLTCRPFRWKVIQQAGQRWISSEGTLSSCDVSAKEACAVQSNILLFPGESVPKAEDYRALILDLLLYRHETLVPVLAALRKERVELEQQLSCLDQKLKNFMCAREELLEWSIKQLKSERLVLLRHIQENDNSRQTDKPKAVKDSGEIDL